MSAEPDGVLREGDSELATVALDELVELRVKRQLESSLLQLWPLGLSSIIPGR